MPQTLLLVGTRKGCFVLRERCRPALLEHSRARTARAGPSTTRSTTRPPARSTRPPRASGTARACGAAPTSARRGSSRARAWLRRGPSLNCRRSRACGRRTGAARRGEGCGVFESRDGALTWSLLSDARRPARPRGLEHRVQPAARAISACRACSASGRADRFWASCRASASSRRPTTAPPGRPQPRAARRLAARAPRGRLLRAQARDVARRPDRLYQQNHCRHAPQRRRRAILDGDHRRTADRVRLRGRRASARP